MKVLREPLLHFLLLGGAIFGAYSLLSDTRASRPGSIVVTEGRIEALVDAGVTEIGIVIAPRSLGRGSVRQPRANARD